MEQPAGTTATGQAEIQPVAAPSLPAVTPQAIAAPWWKTSHGLGIATLLFGVVTALFTGVWTLYKAHNDFELLMAQERTKQAEAARDQERARLSDAAAERQRAEVERQREEARAAARLDLEREITDRAQRHDDFVLTQQRLEQTSQLAIQRENAREQEARVLEIDLRAKTAEAQKQEQLSRERELTQERAQREIDRELQRNAGIASAISKAISDSFSDVGSSEGALAILASYAGLKEHRTEILQAVSAKAQSVRTVGESHVIADIFRQTAPDSLSVACSAGLTARSQLEKAIFWQFASDYLKTAEHVDPFQFLSSFINGRTERGSPWGQDFAGSISSDLNNRLYAFADRKWSDGLSVAGLVPFSPYAVAPAVRAVSLVVRVPGLRRVALGPGLHFSRPQLAAALKQFTDSNPTALEGRRLDAELYLLRETANLVIPNSDSFHSLDNCNSLQHSATNQ